MVPAWLFTLDLTPGSQAVGSGPVQGTLCIRCLPSDTASFDVRNAQVRLGFRPGTRTMQVHAAGRAPRAVSLPVAVEVVSGHPYVPLRAVASALGYHVEWTRAQQLTSVTPSPFAQAFDSAAQALVPLTVTRAWTPGPWRPASTPAASSGCTARSSGHCAEETFGRVTVQASSPPLAERQALTFLIGLWDQSVQFALLAPERVRNTVALQTGAVPDPCATPPAKIGASRLSVISCALSSKALGPYRPFYTLLRTTVF